MATRSVPTTIRQVSRRLQAPLSPRISASRASYSSSPFRTQPSPLRLPADQQAEFERLQQSANTQAPLTADTSSPFPPTATNTSNPEASSAEVRTQASMESRVGTLGEVSNLPLRKGAPPEFDGDTNPKTGEVGGPKNEPLRWGSAGDWSYNGRVTDF